VTAHFEPRANIDPPRADLALFTFLARRIVVRPSIVAFCNSGCIFGPHHPVSLSPFPQIMLIDTPAIVLKSVDFKESSKIITLFTRSHGRLGVLVRGIKRRKSKYAGIMGYGSVLNITLYYKASRSVQTLKEAETRISSMRTQSDFSRLALAMSFLELVEQLAQEGEPNEPLYDFTEQVLQWLNDSVDEGDTDWQPARLFPYLQLRLADLMGVGVQLPDSPDGKLTAGDLAFLNINAGSISSEAELGDGLHFRLNDAQRLYLAMAFGGRSANVLTYPISKQELKQLISHLDQYLRYHIDGVRARKSDAVFEQIL
jgi:DNA repair protein RecO